MARPAHRFPWRIEIFTFEACLKLPQFCIAILPELRADRDVAGVILHSGPFCARPGSGTPFGASNETCIYMFQTCYNNGECKGAKGRDGSASEPPPAPHVTSELQLEPSVFEAGDIFLNDATASLPYRRTLREVGPPRDELDDHVQFQGCPPIIAIISSPTISNHLARGSSYACLSHAEQPLR
ncbi:hypothetical protein B0H17DRAFT_1179929 [Mycena rosella]|uniref:Uncharacterized protein n=1 Tax=Mycena rosella TaxID=1033263 RepID=A0AAD7DG47_MYCRO|nr:hypothetical protein B0H17DRAFT_1179929 [Mycena rosella]